MKPEAAKALRAAFPPSAIGHLPKGGVMLDYVGHAATTDRLLQVDPEWSWEPFALDERGLPALDEHGNLWIRLTVCGVTRPGVGDGKNQKERIGDAIRNAAMRFGVALDLWAKEDLHPDTVAPNPAPVASGEKTLAKSGGGDGATAPKKKPPAADAEECEAIVAELTGLFGGRLTADQSAAIERNRHKIVWLRTALAQAKAKADAESGSQFEIPKSAKVA